MGNQTKIRQGLKEKEMVKTLEEKRQYQREYYKKKKQDTGQYYNTTRSKYYSEHKEDYSKSSCKSFVRYIYTRQTTYAK